jgi:nitrite reductase/ring-hydroxylating ferredoxin subunit
MSPDPIACSAEIKKGRRRFLLQLSWTGLTLYSGAFLAAVFRFLWPRVSDRPALSVQVGFPDDFQPGQVVYNRGLKLFLIRDEKGFLSFSARCTHLGCMVVWNRDHHMFLCPCHGGKFDVEGKNVEGPPPRPLDAFSIRIDDNGYLVVDQDIILKRGQGPLPRFQPGLA